MVKPISTITPAPSGLLHRTLPVIWDPGLPSLPSVTVVHESIKRRPLNWDKEQWTGVVYVAPQQHLSDGLDKELFFFSFFLYGYRTLYQSERTPGSLDSTSTNMTSSTLVWLTYITPEECTKAATSLIFFFIYNIEVLIICFWELNKERSTCSRATIWWNLLFCLLDNDRDGRMGAPCTDTSKRWQCWVSHCCTRAWQISSIHLSYRWSIVSEHRSYLIPAVQKATFSCRN